MITSMLSAKPCVRKRHAWRRYAHVQLSAWTSSTEKTVIAAADAPEALPELSNEASGGAASKGSQQITGWQVQQYLTTLKTLMLWWELALRSMFS